MLTYLKFLLAVIALLPLLLARALDYPPQDHGGADVVLQHGDRIWGEHTNIGRFEIPSTATATVAPYYPNQPGTGGIDIHAQQIIILGILDASGAGYTGGGGKAGKGGPPNDGCARYQPCLSKITLYWGIDGNHGLNRYGGFEPDGPASGAPDGADGGYDAPETNQDISTDLTVLLGSGGKGGSGGEGIKGIGCGAESGFGGGGGGGGGSGGGSVILRFDSMQLMGSILTKGRLGENGNSGFLDILVRLINNVCQVPTITCCDYNGGDGGDGGFANPYPGSRAMEGRGLYPNGQDGGAGAGGGILLFSDFDTTLTITGVLDARGGRNQLGNGGTIKIIHTGALDLTAASIFTPRLYTRNLATDPLPDMDAWFLH